MRARVREAINADCSDEESAEVFRDYLADYAAAWSLFPDVLPCLDHLKACRRRIATGGVLGAIGGDSPHGDSQTL